MAYSILLETRPKANKTVRGKIQASLVTKKYTACCDALAHTLVGLNSQANTVPSITAFHFALTSTSLSSKTRSNRKDAATAKSKDSNTPFSSPRQSLYTLISTFSSEFFVTLDTVRNPKYNLTFSFY